MVELLLVIAIVAVLAALVFLGLNRSKSTAQSASCRNNLRQLGIALQTTVSENNGYPVSSTATPFDATDFWFTALHREGLNLQIASNSFETGIWRCPSAKWSEFLKTNNVAFGYYGYNDDSVHTPPLNIFGLQGKYNAHANNLVRVKESDVTNPSDMMAIGDSFSGSTVFMRRDVRPLEDFGNVRNRHAGKANVVFCDGHVESPTLSFVFENTTDAALSRWNRDNKPHREKYGPPWSYPP